MKFILLSIYLCLFLTGCGTRIGELVTGKNAKLAEIEQLKAEYSADTAKRVKEVAEAKDLVIQGKDKQIERGAQAMYAADLTFHTIPKPIRTDILVNQYVNEGWTALGKAMPDAATMVQINERLQRELDEKQTSLEQLQKNHQIAVTENQKLVDATKAWEEKLKAAEKQQEVAAKKYQDQIGVKQAEVIGLQEKIIALEKERADTQASIQAIKMKLCMITGALALACLAGSIWSPVFKEKFAVGAAAFGLLSLGILYIQPWHIGVAAGVALLGFAVWMTRDHFKEKEAATDVYRAIESIKNKSKETYNTLIKPELKQWIVKYDTKGKPVPNTRAEEHIDARLREVGDK